MDTPSSESESFASSERASVFMVEDSLAIQEMTRTLISAIPQLEWAGGCGTLKEAKRVLGKTVKPSILLLDIRLPGGNGCDLLDSQEVDLAGTKVVFITGMPCDRALLFCLKRQVAGFINKVETAPKEWMVALKAVAQGRRFFSPHVAQLIAELRSDPNHWSRLLSPREIGFLSDIGNGVANEKMAETRKVSDQTVQWHRKNIMSKLSLHSATDLLLWARRAGFAN